MSEIPTVWWVDYDGDPTTDPALFTTQGVAKADASCVHLEANQLGLSEDDPEPVFAWLKHYAGGVEMYVDGEATGIVVREVAVRDAPGKAS